MKRLLGYATLSLGLSGCGPYFTALSPPPPNRVGSLDRSEDTIEISEGVGIVFVCHAGGPCPNASATVDDQKVAKVHPAHLDHLSRDVVAHAPYGWNWSGPQPRSAFVLYGVAPGQTKVRVRYDGGDGEIHVTVLPSPTKSTASR